ncbi:hypothetical protein ACJIZ3_023684 [Penstemon smallii]|uniref:Transposase-associated domain-containing protein n=1 Tax=Penstemon smallii TaxID=265156 RepID=A0ABD3TRP7_9LAMI
MDIRLLRGWMYDRVNRANRTLKEEFKSEVYGFIDHAMSVPGLVSSANEIRCPCRKCGNKKYIKCDVVVVHLCKWGFKDDYWYWTSHGEVDPAWNNNNVEASSSGHFFHTEGNNRYEDLVHDAMRDVVHFFENTEGSDIPNAEYQRFHELLKADQTPLWEGCNTETDLSFSLKMMTMKAECNMTQSCYDRVSNLFKNSYPEENCVPESFF